MTLYKWLKKYCKTFKRLFSERNYDLDLSFPPIHKQGIHIITVKKTERGNYSSPYKRRGKLQKVVTKMYVGENFYRETIEWVEERK